MNDNRRRFIVIIIAVFIVTGALLSTLVADTRARESAVERADTVLVDSAREQAATFAATLNGRFKVLESVATSLALTGKSTPSEVDALLNDIALRANLTFSSLKLVAQDGSYVSAYPSFSGLNVSDRKYFTDALSGDWGMEHVQSRGSGKNSVVLSVPYYVNGKIRGALCGLYYEEDLRALLTSQVYGGRGSSVLIDAGGDIIVNAETEANVISQSNILDILHDPSRKQALSPEILGQTLLTGEGFPLGYNYGGVAYAAVALPLGSAGLPENDWLVFNFVDEDSFLLEINDSRNASITSVLVFAAFAIAALVLFLVLENDYTKKTRGITEFLRQREEQFRIVTEQSGKFVLRYDVATGSAVRSDPGRDGFPGDACCKNIAEDAVSRGIVTSLSADSYRGFFARIDAGESPVTEDILMLRADGASRWYRHTSTTIFDKKGKPETAIISYYDDTEQRERELAYAKWQQELASLPYEDGALYEWNLTRDISDGQRGSLALDYTGLKNDSFNTRAEYFAAHHVAEEDRPAFTSLMNREHLIAMYFSKSYLCELDYRYITEEGDLRWRKISVQLVPYPDDQDIKAYVLNRDIDAEKREELALLARSQNDFLTGAFNRQTFITRVNELLTAHPSASHALLMLDVDGFKRVNDTLGHTAGDDLLRELADYIRAVLRGSDVIGRIGGDEFMVFLPDMPFDAAVGKKAGQLCAALRRRLTDFSISVSVGISVYPRDGESFDELYAHADAALYHVKENGKDSYAFYQPSMKHAAGGLTLIDPGESAPFPKRRAVIVASDSEKQRMALSVILSSDYEIIRITDPTLLPAEIHRSGNSIRAVILDADTPIGRSILNLSGKNLAEKGLCVCALTSDNSEKHLSYLLRSGVQYLFAKPVKRELLLLRLERSYSTYEAENAKLQTAYRRLQTSEELQYREVLNSTGTTVFIYDVATRTYQVDLLSEQATTGSFSGHSLGDEMLKRGLLSAEAVDRVKEAMAKVEKGACHQSEAMVKLLTKSGEKRWYRVRIIRMENTDSLSPKLLITANDVNEQVERDETLRYRAERDALTGLYNRETFFERAAELIAAHEPGYYIMACFDIDKFKVINDQYGIAKGDEILIFIADTFRCGFGAAGGVCCRVMADNFAVLYPASFANSPALAEMREKASVLDGSIQPITFSIGRYLINDKSLPVSAMYDRASIAEVSVKGRFDANIAQYDESMREQLLREQEIINDMNAALSEEQFEVWLQPQYNHSSGDLVGAEALVRWRHPKKGLILPGVFVPVFEKNGFIYEVDKYIWERCCALLRKWLDAGRSPRSLSVNISRYDIFRADLFEVITGFVEKYSVPVELLHLEITETAFATSSEQIISAVKKFIAYGFTVEIDDFGSGYSSLNTLKDVPAQVIKLDMRFLEGKDNTVRGGNILESVVRMAKWLNMSVIAEGVETVEQADFLKSIGCNYVQGYLYARPMSVEEYEALAKSISKAQKRDKLETVENLDNNAFWDPKSMDTLIFNSYIGGACVFEYHNGGVELLRANDKYAQVIGSAGMTVEDALKLRWSEHMDDAGRRAMLDALALSVRSGDEVTGEFCFIDLPGCPHETYLRSTMRVIASAGDRYLVYCTNENVTARHEAEAAVRESTEQLYFLNDISRGLLANGSSEDAIRHVLQKLLEYFDGDRAYVFELDWNRLLTNNTYEICSPGVSRQLDNLQDIPIDSLSVWFDAFERYNHISIGNTASLELDRAEEQRILTDQGITSLVAVPLRRDGAIIGFMGVDNPRQKQSHLDRLEALGDYMAVILTRRDLNDRIDSDHDMLLELMNDTPGAFARLKVQKDGVLSLQYVNDGFRDILGLSREEIMAANKEDALAGVHPDDIASERSTITAAAGGDGRASIKYRLRAKSGAYVWVMAFGRTTVNKAGDVFMNLY